VTFDGNLKCWGSSYANKPISVFGETDKFISVAVGSGHSCLLDKNFGVKCWGNNSSGQLGVADLTGITKSAPVNVDGLSSGVIQVAVGGSHSCALLATGGVKCWGQNGKGQVGNGTVDDQSSPVDVTGLQSGVRAISLGAEFSCALLESGAVKCWGLNSAGQLGDGTNENRQAPVVVSSFSLPINSISTGKNYACALDQESVAWCWGDNVWGQLGDRDDLARNSPVKVKSL
jgi:alpha-tubulin suppressor-like RCC1 family protein